MSERLTKNAARNIFFGGTIFFLVIFIALVANSVFYATGASSHHSEITPSIALGKRVWERNACIDCHTILGEGAYFAPELGNVWARYGGFDDPQGAREGIIGWIKNQPTGIEGRRQMPHFNLSDKELNGLVDFFEWTNKINTQHWPPNDAG
ncbi:c-type cytochrome [Varunaivibrio sulfuroxidans]|uniref:Nitric oxide reductase NorC subunit apoprotein n=1 Tax=Varunaivibrio sulfuroxidans TaxID=1773489 RepID=A0A4R3JFR9_9PROT|nr:cytochrome c [Varunaivibrio sulfuroxidans]TCS64712.1 nitric oxide reductase NorC subunit apoprotein [Varunaivibrio sulfuroxidans]WES29982.1 cytochrome c [Varunaivibrio sulfuroxidans]